MISKEEFREKCKNIIPKEELQKLERDRKKKKTSKIIVILLDILISMLFAMIYSYFILLTIPFTILILVLIVNAIFMNKWNDLKDKYGKDVISILLEGIEHTYDPKGFIDRQIFNESRFFVDIYGKFNGDFVLNANRGLSFHTDYYDKYTGEDLLVVDIPKNDGTPSGVKLSVCDLNVTKEKTRQVTKRSANGSTTTDTETYTEIVYNKTFGFVEFPFQFKCNLSINHNDWDLNKIQLEDINFNKKYNVYTDNHLEALIILTPVMITKLMELSKRIKGFKLKITKTGKMYFGISRNLFSLKVSNKLPIEFMFDRFYEDLTNLLLIINEIKENDKVFKM